MPDRSAVTCPDLTKKQFLFLARKLGCFSKRSLLDVSHAGDWVADATRRHGAIEGIAELAKEVPAENVTVGSPAGSISQAAHSMHRVLVRDISVFQSEEMTPETTIALANLLSCLKPRGRMVIPVSAVDGTEHELWKQRLSGFPGRLTSRIYKTNVLDYASLTFVLRGIHEIPVLEFAIDRKPISRIDWHRFAREAVMARMENSNAAA
ncbi:hypothetical protein [Thalassoglobus sp.]|uniref:hypothetical protein n=1 Tax=Thalassoglobus sp. TaxID=2795869 RepID=UPI003AA9AABF